jgi:pyrimidine-nucleoside phosphorylase
MSPDTPPAPETSAQELSALELIARKRDGDELTPAELRALVLAYAGGDVPDYQMAAFLMAGYLNGFSRAEAVAMTAAMVDSGDTLDLGRLSGPTVDKHSTGGVADGTTLIVAPLAAALGLQVVKLSGRGLGHTGGTLDKLESVPGFRVELSEDELLDQVERIGLAVAAQSARLVPADKAMYALRDATATVADTALIAASVMSKKLAGGAASILLDVKTGNGAFMKEPAAARELAELCCELGAAAGRTTAALVTDMSQPLGDLVGNAVEVREAVEVLRGEHPGHRLTELCLTLTGHMAALGGVAADPDSGYERAKEALDSGAGLGKLRALFEAQGGDPGVVDDLGLLPQAPATATATTGEGGWLAAVDTEGVGRLAASLGAGRARKEDEIDPAVAVELPVKLGDRLGPGDPVGTVRARDQAAADRAAAALTKLLTFGADPVEAPPLVHDQIRPADGQPEDRP